MVKKIKISPVLFIVSLFLIFTIINLTAARNTTQSTLETNGHAARFHVTIDGAPTSTVNNKIYATSKISDIQQSGEVYTGGSFIDGAYRANSIVIHNDSDTKVNIELGITRTTNDSRVFYAILPNCATEQDIYAKLYAKTNGASLTPSQVQDICDDFNDNEYTLEYDDYLRLTFITWSEHDSVYVDSDNDGVADEADKKLSELTDGIPQDTFDINCYIVQKD